MTVEHSKFDQVCEIFSLDAPLAKVFEMTKVDRLYIYTTHRQGYAHEQQQENTDMDTMINIEDYQQNMAFTYSKNRTSLAYTTNRTSFAVYPICIELFGDDGQLK